MDNKWVKRCLWFDEVYFAVLYMLFAVDSTFFVSVPLVTPGLHPHSKAHLPAPFPPDCVIISYNTTLLSLCRENCFLTLLKGHHLSPLICLWKSSLGVSCRRHPPLNFQKKFECFIIVSKHTLWVKNCSVSIWTSLAFLCWCKRCECGRLSENCGLI